MLAFHRFAREDPAEFQRDHVHGLAFDVGEFLPTGAGAVGFLDDLADPSVLGKVAVGGFAGGEERIAGFIHHLVRDPERLRCDILQLVDC